MGMFKSMKEGFQVIRSDELKDIKRKADAQPKTSMMDGLKLANQAMDQAGQFQAEMGQSGLSANPMQNMATMGQGVQGSATVRAIRDTGTLINNSPVVELDLTVTVPGQEPYPVTHRQLISPVVMANFQPGATFGVRVDQNDPSKIIIG
jgi:hypothetical protein